MPPNIHLAVAADTITSGLVEQIELFLNEHQDTNLIIIDTLQKVRQSSSESAYSNDYNDLSAVKKIADNYAVAIMFINHSRKRRDDDPLYTVSGTTGITGAADDVYVFEKDKRISDNSTLFCSGRDIENGSFTGTPSELFEKLKPLGCK